MSGQPERVQLIVTLDLAEVGDLSTVQSWQAYLQRLMDDHAKHFRPVVLEHKLRS